MRQLATIQEIASITPIEGADSIELAKFKDIDWQCVTKKGEFRVGDKSVYFEIDSLVEGVKGLEFMEKSKYRVKTIRLRGTLSQGLAMPLSVFGLDESIPVGTDVTEKLGVKLYENPQEARNKGSKGGGRFGLPGGAFPDSLANKTNEVRCQNISRSITKEGFGDVTFIGREKMDGSSMTLIMQPKQPRYSWLSKIPVVGQMIQDRFNLYDQKLIVCSRNLRLKHPTELKKGQDQPGHFWNAVNATNAEKAMAEWCNRNNKQLVVQAEVIGPGTGSQGDYYDIKTHKMFVFDVMTSEPGKKAAKYIDQSTLNNWVEDIFGDSVPTAPIVYQMKLPFDDHRNLDTEKLLSMSDRKTEIPGLKKVNSEGVVWRPINEMSPPSDKFDNNRLSFKVISNSFLLKQKD